MSDHIYRPACKAFELKSVRVLTGAACDREKKEEGGSSSLSSVQCLALYTALVGDCNKNTEKQIGTFDAGRANVQMSGVSKNNKICLN